MALALTAFEQLLSEDGVEEGRMLHNLGLRSGNAKYFAFERKDELVVKLPADRVAELIASRAGRVMDRGQPDRPLREWVCLRPADEAAAVAFMREARSFVDPATDYARQLSIRAPRAAAFRAIRSPQAWWTPLVEDLGSSLVFRFDGIDEKMEFRVDTEVPPSSLQWTCVRHSGAPAWDGSVITFELLDRGESCELAFRHEGVARGMVEPGWERFLGSLADYVETGVGRPFVASRAAS
jgi:Activator of Hsp90 ATPase homolog 1-like protein